MNTEQLQKRIETLEQQMKEHYHNGVVGRRVDIRDTVGFIKTITLSAELANIVLSANPPRKVWEQILIDTTTGTKKLYVYDTVGHTWLSTTIT